MVKTEVVAEAKSLVLLVAPQVEKFEEKERALEETWHSSKNH